MTGTRELREQPAMPYIDSILRGRSVGSDVLTMWPRDIHWGYWEDPEAATDSYSEFATAAARMTEKVIDAAGVRDGMAVLDSGCGLGGTIGRMNDRFSSCNLVGLNVDRRQLEVATDLVTPRAGNTVTFVHGNACEMPFEPDSFDRLLAVECIFHYPSRVRFFREAARVLRKGGYLTLTDYVPVALVAPAVVAFLRAIPFWGDVNPIVPTMPSYRMLARLARMTLVRAEDVTRNTVPSCDVLVNFSGTVSRRTAWQSRLLCMPVRLGLLRYPILTFRKW